MALKICNDLTAKPGRISKGLKAVHVNDYPIIIQNRGLFVDQQKDLSLFLDEAAEK